jgi:hypothetical protein
MLLAEMPPTVRASYLALMPLLTPFDALASCIQVRHITAPSVVSVDAFILLIMIAKISLIFEFLSR